MTKQPFLEAIPILEQLQAHGFEAYFVGGAVRDYLMARPIHDVDITTSATPDEIEAIFKHTIPIGKAHGTINVLEGGHNYEITTYRTESEYVDHRRPSSVQFVRDLYEDVLRRDFTMNAIAMDQHFHIVDHFNGADDIQHRLIRTVAKPDDRFEEDALRILRGVRFHAQLAFDIEADTLTAMHHHIAEIEYLSIERIVTELKKLFLGENAVNGFRLLQRLDAFKYMPYFKPEVIKTMHIQSPMPFTFFIALTQCIDTHNTQSLHALKLSNAEQQEIHTYRKLIQWLPQLKDEAALRLCIYDFGATYLHTILDYIETLRINQLNISTISSLNHTQIKTIETTLPLQSRKALAINGNDLMTLYNKPAGAWIKDVLRQIECAVVQSEVPNEKTKLAKWVRTHVKIS